MTANGNFEATKQKIKQWLVNGQGSVQDITDKGKVWAILVQTGADVLPVVVSMEMRHPEIVSVSINVELDAYISAFDQLDQAEKRNLLYDLRIALLQRADIGFNVPNTLSPLSLNTALYLEELTKPTIFRSLDKIENSFRLVEFLLNKRFEIDAP